MSKVYSAKWCPHCVKTVQFLRDNNIDFEYIEIEEQPQSVIAKIIEVNGGHDWVVPTIEHNGTWRPGQVFNPGKLESDLKEMDVL